MYISNFYLSNNFLNFQAHRPIQDLRKEYSQQGLSEGDESIKNGQPFELFSIWLNDACASGVIEPNAMCLSTCVDNRPSSRFVLLKGFDSRGFVWYTNYESRKAQGIYMYLIYTWSNIFVKMHLCM